MLFFYAIMIVGFITPVRGSSRVSRRENGGYHEEICVQNLRMDL